MIHIRKNFRRKLVRSQRNADELVMVLEESGQTKDDGCDGDDDNVAIRSLYGAQSLSVQRSTHGDVPINCQQNRQPGVDHTHDVGARKQPGIHTSMDVNVVGVVDERSDIT